MAGIVLEDMGARSLISVLTTMAVDDIVTGREAARQKFAIASAPPAADPGTADPLTWGMTPEQAAAFYAARGA